MPAPHHKNDVLNNVASERAALAGICRYGIECYIDIEPFLSESTFTVDMNKIIYKCLKHLFKKSNSVDFASILSSAQDLNLSEFLEKYDGLKHIRAIIETPINIENVRDHAIKIKRLEFARNLQLGLGDIYHSLKDITGDEPLSSILSLVEEPVNKISNSFIKEENNSPKLVSLTIKDYVKYLSENQCDQIGLSTGMPDFDKAIGGGLRRKCFDIIGARQKCGKSSIADNIALHVSSQGIPVLYLDSEMDEKDHHNRILANLSSIEIDNIARGKFHNDESSKRMVDQSVEKISKYPMYFLNVTGKGFDEVLGIARRWLLKEVGFDENGNQKDCLIIYDYFKLSTEEYSGDLKEYQQLAIRATKLHNFCVQYDVPCLTFVQLNRDGITKETTDTIRGADAILDSCTSFSIFKAKTEEEIIHDGVVNGNRKMITLLSRHGPAMDIGEYMCLDLKGQFCQIKSIGMARNVCKQRAARQEGFKKSGSVKKKSSSDSTNDF